MLKRFLKRRVEAFERQWDYDATYLKEVVEASPAAMVKITFAQPLVHHRDGAPRDAWLAAAIATTKAADCAPCFELVLKMARASGMADPLVVAIASGVEEAMTEEAALGYAFARAVLARDIEESARLRAKIVRTWGRKALVALSTAVATASFYPTLKWGMGRGRRIGGLGAAIAERRAEAA